MSKIILINGKKRAGKDYIANLIKEEINSKGYSVEIMSFADPMKDIISKSFDISLEELEDYKNEKTKIAVKIPKLDGYLCDVISDFRILLQRFGTEAMKPIFGDSVWADLLYKKAQNSEADYVIVPDFRFIVENIPNYCTICIKNYDVDHNDSHASENELNDYWFDIVLDNTGYIITKEDIKDLII